MTSHGMFSRIKKKIRYWLMKYLHLDRPMQKVVKHETVLQLKSKGQLEQLEKIRPGITRILAKLAIDAEKNKVLLEELARERYTDRVIRTEEVIASQQDELAKNILRRGLGHRAPGHIKKVRGKKIRRLPIALSIENIPLGGFLGIWSYEHKFYPVIMRKTKKGKTRIVVIPDGVDDMNAVYTNPDTLKSQLKSRFVMLSYTKQGVFIPQEYKES